MMDKLIRQPSGWIVVFDHGTVFSTDPDSVDAKFNKNNYLYREGPITPMGKAIIKVLDGVFSRSNYGREDNKYVYWKWE